MIFGLTPELGVAIWMAAGAALGVCGMMLRQKLQAWREARIAAGTPIEAIQNKTNVINVPPELLSTGDHFALEVRGDSMIEAGILDGDTVIVQRCESAENGTIVVALIDNVEVTLKRLRRRGGSIVVALVDENEVTLKRLRRRGNSIALEAANPRYETRIFGPDRVRVQGRLIGLLRKY